MWTFFSVLPTSKGLGLELGLVEVRVKVRHVEAMFRVRVGGLGMDYVSESPHKGVCV